MNYNNENKYYSKYIKYKMKYLELKKNINYSNESGGGIFGSSTPNSDEAIIALFQNKFLTNPVILNEYVNIYNYLKNIIKNEDKILLYYIINYNNINSPECIQSLLNVLSNIAKIYDIINSNTFIDTFKENLISYWTNVWYNYNFTNQCNNIIIPQLNQKFSELLKKFIINQNFIDKLKITKKIKNNNIRYYILDKFDKI